MEKIHSIKPTLYFVQDNHSNAYISKDDDFREQGLHIVLKKTKIQKHLNGGASKTKIRIIRGMKTDHSLSDHTFLPHPYLIRENC